MRAVAFVALIPLLPACSPADKNRANDQVISTAFARFTAAETYDTVCNTPRRVSPDNENWVGNMVVLASRMGAIIARNNPGVSVEDASQHLMSIREMLIETIGQDLKTKGCKTPGALQSARMLDLYLSTPPATVSAIYDEAIRKSGGQI